MRERWRQLGIVLLSAAALAAQDDPPEQLPLRVSSLRPNGAVIVDRGKRDGVQIGDRVTLAPRNGAEVQGTVTEVDERTALVDLADPTAVVPIGTRGFVLVPAARRQPSSPPPRPAVPPEPQPPQPAPPEQEEWRPGMPLLGTTRPPQPGERPGRLDGRVYAAANLVRTLDTWSHSYLDTGVDAELSNVGGAGGVLRFHGAFDWSRETSERTDTDLRLYELAYEHGGTRWSPWRWQVGRLLPRDVPEFGLLDGAEVGYRRENGHRWGASFGWLPELDEDLESFGDLQIAGWYVWNQDVAERLSVAVGYQKTWHRGDADRDLVLVKWRHLPTEGWTVSGGLWIDFYTSGDDLKDESVEVTRANVFANRRWQGGSGIDLAYDHEEYPEQLRRELPQTILPQTLIDAHQDRVRFHGFVPSGESTRWYTRLTGWIDEQREGGAAELGFDSKGLLSPQARSGMAVFHVQGLTSTVLGVRIEHGGSYSYGRLDLLYEVGFVHHESFPDDRDDLLQHRLGALLTTDLGGGWDATFFFDGTLWDEELSLGLGLHVQRYF